MRIRKSLIVIGLVALAPTAALAPAWRRRKRRSSAASIPLPSDTLRPLVARGDARAEEALGALYDAGLGVAPNAVRAAKLFRQAALQGSGAAQLNLANLYIKGRGVQANAVLAYAWADAAAASGEPGGQDILDRLAKEMPRAQLKRAQSLAQRYVELYVESFRSG